MAEVVETVEVGGVPQADVARAVLNPVSIGRGAGEGRCQAGSEGPCPQDLRHAIELLFFAYRDFTAEADSLLGRYGFGRAHHRVIYFVGRHPGITVSDLLRILRITKQSLGRVLGQLVRDGFVVQRADVRDRRRRRLYLTAEAAVLERRLTAAQARHVAEAFAAVGDEAAAGFRAVLQAMIKAEDRPRFDPSPAGCGS